MNFIVDTNVISEVRKGERCNAHVAAWYGSIGDGDLYLSVLVVGEVRKSIELLEPRDPVKARALSAWLAQIEGAFGERILPVDRAVAEEWGRMSARRPIPVVDGLLAATARTHRMTLVTRNDADVEGLGAKVLNPFTARSGRP